MTEKQVELTRTYLTFEERMRRRQAEEDEQARLEAEKLQQAYLKRTGRSEIKP